MGELLEEVVGTSTRVTKTILHYTSDFLADSEFVCGHLPTYKNYMFKYLAW